MARRPSQNGKAHKFKNKLLLNQWLISLFGINPLIAGGSGPQKLRPFHQLANMIRGTNISGLDNDNLHHFYHAFTESDFFFDDECKIPRNEILNYEQNIIRHTEAINSKRERPIVWKYYQWLNLLFVEVYLDKFFYDRYELLQDLNHFTTKFNDFWPEHEDMPPYKEEDLNKICLQNATGSGKTLLMHVNLLQYRHYAKQHGKDKELSRAILLTPNESLSKQHIVEFGESDISATGYLQSRGQLFGSTQNLEHVDVLEITKLADQEGPNTIATRSLGDQNLLFVDEGHRGLRDSKEGGAWLKRRSQLCVSGFTFEYSATFEQALAAGKRQEFENDYAKNVIFDYSYRWFYEDGFGKDYQIFNLPKSPDNVQKIYLTACLLKFYQQIVIYEEGKQDFSPFNIEKPLWLFIGSTVSHKSQKSKDEKTVVSDVAAIIKYIAYFVGHRREVEKDIRAILMSTGEETGLLDQDGQDIFLNRFSHLREKVKDSSDIKKIYSGILKRLFNHSGGGHLSAERIKGDSGEIALRLGEGEYFGLINVGDAKGLCDVLKDMAVKDNIPLQVKTNDFIEPMFEHIKDSTSNINLLIGSKKFIEGWDCWRVSNMGLMHVGQKEGAQIIQLFGRGVRLKGYKWELRRSGYSSAKHTPPNIHEMETLNVFGIKADFMEKFRDYLKSEGLPGNERHQRFTIPLNVTHDFGKKLMILRPKLKDSDGKEYSFKKDAPVPFLGDKIPNYFKTNQIIVDFYPKIQSLQSVRRATSADKHETSLTEQHLALLDYDQLFFEMEQFKRERTWHNLNISKDAIKKLLANRDWYKLYLPEVHLKPHSFDGVLLFREIAKELLKRYCDRYYNYRKREFIEPRLELRELTPADDNILKEDYTLVVDSEQDEKRVIQDIKTLKEDIEQNKEGLIGEGIVQACNLDIHLFRPLLHVRKGKKIAIMPASLNESEYQFVCDLYEWCNDKKSELAEKKQEIFLLRNSSRGKGVGFFEAGNFHPDFILWMLSKEKQYVTFVDPHGLMHEGVESEKINLHKSIKAIEERLNEPTVVLNSFILSATKRTLLRSKMDVDTLEKSHVLFMEDGKSAYIQQLFNDILADI